MTTSSTTTTTSSHAPRPTCFRYLFRDNPPRPADCGHTGHRNGRKAKVLGYGDPDSVETCAEICDKTDGCKAIVYGYRDYDLNKPFCELVDAPHGRDDSDDTPWMWYDLSCFNPDCLPPPGHDCGY
ncbi:hypothetical protein ACHAPJ_001699 [Fusarium lateritium]